ncbi:MAG: acyl-CoA thioesterase [Deltaproteobacteria bacterium]|nr:acyl-CoA thioesterase [Deltaproteobacteria bacterium]
MSRRKKAIYFQREAGRPAPLVAASMRKVRFEEVDPLGIVWHGRYASYLEDGRVAFGEKYDLSYMTMRKERFLAPIVQMHVDYHSPLRYDDDFTIAARLVWSDAVKLNFEYILENSKGMVAATGYTVQLLTDPEQNVLLARPPFVENLCRRWMKGEIT